MMTSTLDNQTMPGKDLGRAKPLLIRTVFVLNMLKIAFAVGLLIAVQFFDVSIGGLTASILLMTIGAYVLTFAAMVWSILNRNVTAYRAAMIADILVSIPQKAFIGIAIGVLGLALTLFSKSMKAYFAYRT